VGSGGGAGGSGTNAQAGSSGGYGAGAGGTGLTTANGIVAPGGASGGIIVIAYVPAQPTYTILVGPGITIGTGIRFS
jgi:hypothetical protein